MRIQMRYLALAVLLALLAPPVVRAQDNTEAASADPVATRVQRQDRVRVHQPSEGVAVRERSEEQMRLEGTTASRAETRQRAQTGTRSSRDGATGSRRIQARDNASASRVRNSTRQRARVHRPARP